MQEPSRTFESFILLPLPGVVCGLERLGHTSAECLCLGKDGRFWKGLVRDAPAGMALAAGRHHDINFDADSARDAALQRFVAPD